MRPYVGLILLIALPAFAEDSMTPIDLARSVSSDGPVYAYDMVYETKDISATGRVDPTQPAGKRITVTSPPKEDWPKDFENGLKEIDAEADGDIWCASMLDAVPENPELIAADGVISRYSFKPVAEDKEDEKFMKHLTGTIDIDTTDGAVLAFSMVAKKAFKPNMMVKISSFRMAATCERGPDGRTYAADVDTKISASAAMQTIDEHTVRKITALYPTE